VTGREDGIAAEMSGRSVLGLRTSSRERCEVSPTTWATRTLLLWLWVAQAGTLRKHLQPSGQEAAGSNTSSRLPGCMNLSNVHSVSEPQLLHLESGGDDGLKENPSMKMKSRFVLGPAGACVSAPAVMVQPLSSALYLAQL
jgi:hypothetical protein